MKKVTLVVACFVFFLSVPMSRSNAQMMGDMRQGGMGMMRGMGGGMMGAEHPVWGMLMELKLNDHQRDKIRTARQKATKEMIRKSADIRIAQLELKDLLDKDPVDMKAVEAKLRHIEKMRTDMRLSLIKAVEEVKATLTPEQKKQLKEMLETSPRMGMMRGCDCGMMGCAGCGMMRGMMREKGEMMMRQRPMDEMMMQEEKE